MNVKRLLILSTLLTVALAVAAIAAGLSLPPDLQLPMHWNAAGEVDRHAGKWTALLMPIGLAVAGTLLALVVTRTEPNRDAVKSSAGLIGIVWIGMVGLAWVIELMEFAVAFHWPIHPVRIVIGALGLFFVAMGNQFGKSRPMYLVGIRTPWTLADPDVWIATHRLGGKLFVAAGAIWFGCALSGVQGKAMPAVLLAIMLTAAFVPVFWSYVLWRRRGRPQRGL